MIFWCQSSIIHASVDIHIDIQAVISMQWHSSTDIRKQWIFMNGYPCFMDISLQLSILLWISIWISLDFFGYSCIDLLWIHCATKFGSCLVLGVLTVGLYSLVIKTIETAFFSAVKIRLGSGEFFFLKSELFRCEKVQKGLIQPGRHLRNVFGLQPF